jgi:cell division protein FtsB
MEVLRMRMEAIVKDREIKKLKAENENLRAENESLRGHTTNTSGTYETGSKRRCL